MSTLTPNYGLKIPEATDSLAQVRADYATNLGIIDNISGGGGGGGNVYGAFIDTNNVIQASTMYRGNLTYVATQDCVVFCEIVAAVNNSAYIAIDGEEVEYLYSENVKQSRKPSVFLRKGQTLTAYSSVGDWNAYYTVYGLIQGTENIFTPIIYSDNERMIGIWRDNKPLYQKTLTYVGNINANTTNNFADVSALDIDTFVSGLGNGYESGWGWEQLPANLTQIHYNPTSGYIELVTGAIAISGTTYITIQYTKTTDTAGSGNWNTDGIPMVHYSTSEQVIGTYLGQTLYQTTFILPSTINVSYTSWSDMGVSVANGEKVVGCFGIATDGTHSQLMAYFDSDVVKCQSARNGNPSYNVQEITIQYTKSS